jgi:hypothetical protein
MSISIPSDIPPLRSVILKEQENGCNARKWRLRMKFKYRVSTDSVSKTPLAISLNYFKKFDPYCGKSNPFFLLNGIVIVHPWIGSSLIVQG